MGKCKTEMVQKVYPFRNKKENKASTYAEFINSSYKKLEDLIEIKQNELTSEKNREAYNKKALTNLELQLYHFEKIMSLIEEYTGLK